jgi:hypothetical protein
VPALLAGAAFSCANVEAPPGTTPDLAPPTVRERYPAPDAVVPDLDGDVVLRFDEPIQSPRSLERQLDYSPAFAWRFTAMTNGFKVRPRDGWRPDVVYRVRVEPGVSDLLRNRTTLPIEWSFSTGPEIPPTRIEGTIFDRVTVRGVQDARLLFLPPDSTPYTVVSDTGGVFSMRGLPPGPYTILGFVDQNQNRRLDDAFEPWDSAEVVLVDANARLALDLWMIPPDSTPPALIGVTAPDSLTVVLELDDPLDPGTPLDAVVISVSAEDGAPGPAVDSVEVGVPESEPDSAAAAAAEEVEEAAVPVPDDSLPGEAEAGEAELAAPEPEAGPPPVPGARDESGRPSPEAEPEGQEPEQEVLRRTDLPPPPSTSVTAHLASPLRVGTWRVRASGLANLRGLVGGGDTTFVYEPPPVVEEAPVPGDTLAPVPGDTLAPVPGDTPVPVPGDTLAPAALDSLAAPAGDARDPATEGSRS